MTNFIDTAGSQQRRKKNHGVTGIPCLYFVSETRLGKTCNNGKQGILDPRVHRHPIPSTEGRIQLVHGKRPLKKLRESMAGII